MSEFLLDASALLALLNEEDGAGVVAEVVASAAISAVNLSETATKLGEAGMPDRTVQRLLGMLKLPVVAFDEAIAYRAARLRKATKKFGLSLGDRACLATAEMTGACAITADRAWTGLRLPVKVRCIR